MDRARHCRACGTVISARALRCPECLTWQSKRIERVALVVLVVGFAFVGWLLLDFSAWFVPASWLAYSAVGPALIAGWVLSGWKPQAKTARMVLESMLGHKTPIIRLGMTLFIGLIVWHFSALVGPAAWTLAMGNGKTVEKRVEAYYSGASHTCRHRLILEDFNPFGGGFCFFNDPTLELRKGAKARLQVQESSLGILVRAIEGRDP
jgi:hypothetical protein